MITIWNHDLKADRCVFTGDTQRTIGAGSFKEYSDELAKEILAESKRMKVPFSTELPSRINIAGTSAVPAQHVAASTSYLGTVIPIEIFNKDNLLRLDRDVLLKIAECIGAVPLLDENTSKKVIVAEIEETLGRTESKKETQKISELPKPSVPPTETGDKQTTAAVEKEP